MPYIDPDDLPTPPQTDFSELEIVAWMAAIVAAVAIGGVIALVTQ